MVKINGGKVYFAIWWLWELVVFMEALKCKGSSKRPIVEKYQS